MAQPVLHEAAVRKNLTEAAFALVLLPVGIFFYPRYNRRELEKKYRMLMTGQFKDALLSVSAALRAGYSMENALKESAAEMETMYGKKALICRELSFRSGESYETLAEQLTAFSDSVRAGDFSPTMLLHAATEGGASSRSRFSYSVIPHLLFIYCQ